VSLFTSEELEYNTKLRTELFNLISSGDSILFVGSGLSMSVGFPSWDGLLKQLETLALSVGTGFVVDNNMRENDPLLYADKIKKHFSDNSLLARYYNKLHEIFEKKKPNNFRDSHKKLVRLPFPIILTTNYDTVLSDALLQVQSEDKKPLDSDLCFPVNDETRPLMSKFLMALHKSLDFPKKVAHLHGYFSRQNELVLTKSDYEKCYNISLDGQAEKQNLSLHFLVLWSLMATRRIVFFGFGMNDPYLKLLLENVCRDLWQWERPTHINVAPIESSSAKASIDDAKKLREEFGVDTFFYENGDGTFKELEELITELHDFIFPSQPKESPLTEPTSNTASTVADLITQAQGSATGHSSWITDMNKKLSVGGQNADK
jgi:hypothetical protein